MDNDDLDATGPQPEKPAMLDTRQPGMEVIADIFSINDKALGAGEPDPREARRARDVSFPKCERDRNPPHCVAWPQIQRDGDWMEIPCQRRRRWMS